MRSLATFFIAEEEMYSRPMVGHRTSSGSDFDGTLYFLTSNKTGKCNDLVRFPKVNLAYSHPGKNTFVSVSGRAELMADQAKVTAWTTCLSCRGLVSRNT